MRRPSWLRSPRWLPPAPAWLRRPSADTVVAAFTVLLLSLLAFQVGGLINQMEQQAQQRAQRVEQLTEQIEQSRQETRDVALCIAEQLVEHRRDNRNSHDTLAGQHNDVAGKRITTGLPPPPRALPEPREDWEQQLLNACRPYLKLREQPGR